MDDDNDGTDIIVRPARADDVPAVAGLINGYATQDLMLPRSPEQLLRHLPDFVVAEASGHAAKCIVGCAGLARLSPELAEIRSLAVAADVQGRGVGRALVGHLLQVAHEAGIAQVCALTLRPHFFEGIGFQIVDRWDISPKIWQECIYCPKFHHCDEIAVLINLEETMPVAADAAHWGQFLRDSVPVAWRRNLAAAMGK